MRSCDWVGVSCLPLGGGAGLQPNVVLELLGAAEALELHGLLGDVLGGVASFAFIRAVVEFIHQHDQPALGIRVTGRAAHAELAGRGGGVLRWDGFSLGGRRQGGTHDSRGVNPRGHGALRGAQFLGTAELSREQSKFHINSTAHTDVCSACNQTLIRSDQIYWSELTVVQRALFALHSVL